MAYPEQAHFESLAEFSTMIHTFKGIFSFFLQRVLSLVPVVLLVALVAFGLVHIIPGDPAISIAGESAGVEEIERVREAYGFNDPFLVQFWSWLTNALRGDFGRSFQYDVPVMELVLRRLGTTASIVAVSLVIATVVGTSLGIVSGLNPRSPTDKVVSFTTSLLLAVPSFWAAMLLITLFALTWRMFPATGFTPLTDGFGSWLRSLVLPSVAVALTSIADIARQTRSSVLDVRTKDFVRTAQAMGIPKRIISLKHVLRNAGIPIITIVGLQVERLIAAAVVVEILFAMPGVGELMMNSVYTQDIPVIQGGVLVVAVIVVATNLLVDLSYPLINPKLRRVGS